MEKTPSESLQSELSTADIQTRWFTLRSKLAEGVLPRADFGVFEARPAPGSRVRGGIVLIQEIFGINHHIRSVAERYARLGYAVWAPAFFDHIQNGVEMPYDARAVVRGRDFVAKLGWDHPLEDIRLCIESIGENLASADSRHVAVIGYCWGGALAWLASCRLKSSNFTAAISYYGRQAWDFRAEKPLRPTVMHFGEHDPLIPMQNVSDLREAHPELPIFVYNAGHGFNCDERADFNADASALALARTLKFLEENGL